MAVSVERQLRAPAGRGQFYDIDIEGAIQAPDAQDTLDACVATADPLFCDQVNRSPSGSGTITSIEGTLNNIGGIETSGVDLNFDLALGESGAGQFRFQLMASFLFDYDELFANSAGGFDRVDRTGQELGSPTRGFVEEKATLNTFWNLGEFSALLALRYVSALTEQCVGLVADFGETARCSDPVGLTNELTASCTRISSSRGIRKNFRRRLGVRGRRTKPHGRVAARMLFVRPEQPRRHHLPDRGPVLVRPGDIPELTPASPSWPEKPPQGGFSLFPADSTRRPQRPEYNVAATASAG